MIERTPSQHDKIRANERPEERQKREQIEAKFVKVRLAALAENPDLVPGRFDTEHLKAINKYIFQDMPRAGYPEYAPGQFREPTPKGVDRYKQRQFETISHNFFIAYSAMDKESHSNLNKLLKEASPDKLKNLKTEEFIKHMAKIYSNADYIHPFPDGNSRTLREFTRQLAEKSGYTIDWKHIGKSEAGRDILYIARDLSVAEISKDKIRDPMVKEHVQRSQEMFEGNKNLETILSDLIRPTRAIEFEKSYSEGNHELKNNYRKVALINYPELETAYEVIDKAEVYANIQFKGDKPKHNAFMKEMCSHVQARLDSGETRQFAPNEKEKQNIQNAISAISKEPNPQPQKEKESKRER